MLSIVRPSATAVSRKSARLPLDHSRTIGRQAMPGQIVLDHPSVERIPKRGQPGGVSSQANERFSAIATA
jgi:hypothetical protein